MRDRFGDEVADFSRLHHRQPLVVLACCVSLIYAVRSPESLLILFAALSKFLQPYGLSMHLEFVPLMRSQIELIQNLSWQMLPKSELTALEHGNGTFPSGMKPRIILMVAATHISVIVPTWNEQKYLPKCPRSLLDQSVKAHGTSGLSSVEHYGDPSQ